MTFKKSVSLLLALSMVLGLLAIGVFAADPATPPVIHETTNLPTVDNTLKVEGNTTAFPLDDCKVYYLGAKIGDSVHLVNKASNDKTNNTDYINSSVRRFPTTSDLSDAKNVYILKWDKKASDGDSLYRLFLTTALGSDKNDASDDTISGINLLSGVASQNGAGTVGKVTATNTKLDTAATVGFKWDAEKGFYQDNTLGEDDVYVLCITWLTDKDDATKGRYYMVAKKWADVEANPTTYYPVKMYTTDCDYQWKSDESGHWKECSCGAKKDEAAHSHEWMVEGDSHWQECVCGDKIVADTHTPATEWSKDADNHWHVCSCGYITDKSAHTYGDYVQDYVNGQQTKTCSGCGDQVTVSLSHDCTADETKWYVDGEYHYRKCSLCGEAMESTKAKHTYPETFEKDETQHWQVCTVCDELSTKADHDHKTQKNDDQHWTACACGDETTKENHNYTNWTVTTPATETTAGSRTGKCACGAEKTVPIPPVLKEGVYYVTAKISGKDYYLRLTASGENVNTTVPVSLYTTDSKEAAAKVNIVKIEDTDTYTIELFLNSSNQAVRVYMYDTKNDGVIQTGHHANNGVVAEAKHGFLWDAENKLLYKMVGDVKYILSFKTVKNSTTNADEIRLLGVPESEVTAGTAVAATVEMYHEHSFGESWKSDETGHWHDCACGEKNGADKHTVTTWTVTEEATADKSGTKTGKCDICEYELTETIPATGPEDAPELTEGTYYLSAMVNGTKYFFYPTTSVKGGSVTSTVPNSLYTTTDGSVAGKVEVVGIDGTKVYTLEIGEMKVSDVMKTVRIYVYDVTNDGKIGTGHHTKAPEADKHGFYWDAEGNYLYQMEGNVKYILAFKTLMNTKTNTEEVRLQAVPESEVTSGAAVAAVLIVDPAAPTGDESMVALLSILMVVSLCAMAAVLTTRKKFF